MGRPGQSEAPDYRRVILKIFLHCVYSRWQGMIDIKWLKFFK
jgi:hypothetical protein